MRYARSGHTLEVSAVMRMTADEASAETCCGGGQTREGKTPRRREAGYLRDPGLDDGAGARDGAVGDEDLAAARGFDEHAERAAVQLVVTFPADAASMDVMRHEVNRLPLGMNAAQSGTGMLMPMGQPATSTT